MSVTQLNRQYNIIVFLRACSNVTELPCVCSHNNVDHLGFAEVCICCKIAVALERNASRRFPIPETTIVNMEQRLEVPDPTHHTWESRSTIIYNDGHHRENFLEEALLVRFIVIMLAL